MDACMFMMMIFTMKPLKKPFFCFAHSFDFMNSFFWKRIIFTSNFHEIMILNEQQQKLTVIIDYLFPKIVRQLIGEIIFGYKVV